MNSCDRDQHASREDAVECCRRRHRERWEGTKERCPDWREQIDRLMTPVEEPDPPRHPKPFPELFRGRFIATVADDPEFRDVLAGWLIGGAA